MELRHVDGNGMVKANGAAFYDANATGKLAYLSNTVSVYTDEVDNTQTARQWEGFGVGMEQVTNNVRRFYKASSMGFSSKLSLNRKDIGLNLPF